MVNVETGELVKPMDADNARRLTERLRIAAANYTEAKATVLALVDEAKAGGAHVALGYKSWTAYLSDVLSDEPLRLARDEARELTVRLSGEGMTERAIAPIVGTSPATVHRDLTASYEATDEPTVVRVTTGLDGRERTAVTSIRTRPRRALADQFFDAAFDLGKAVDRVARLADDDRFTQNAGKVAAKNRDDLLRARDVLDDVIARLP